MSTIAPLHALSASPAPNAPATLPLVLAERNVPRYTSYPTAPHFHAGITRDAYGEWLAQLPAQSSLSLYMHVPYCTSICLYCGCTTKAVKRHDPIANYAAHLIDEIKLVSARAGSRRVTHWHWGGGTPSILGDDLLRRVHRTVSALFDLSGLVEHAIELDPRMMSPELAATLKAIGVNRASLGAQDFAPHVQEAIGREQPFVQVFDSVKWLREAGIENINLDLMYGLPRQNLNDVRTSARLATSLGPQRLALFGYAHVPWFKTHQRVIVEKDLPGTAERFEQAQAAAEIFREAGYVAIGLDHFALPDDELARAQGENRLHRNFQGYTNDAADALIGLGASAISSLPQGYVQNAPDSGGYMRAIATGHLASVKGISLSRDDRMRARIIEKLMCDFAVDLDEFACSTQVGLRFADELSALAELAAEGLVEREGHVIRITERGRPFVRLAAATFDAYLTRQGAKHSRAV